MHKTLYTQHEILTKMDKLMW